MRVAVIGAGAIGGWLAAGCVKAGASTIVLARGASYDALKADGLRLDTGTTEKSHAIEVTRDARDLRGADLLILGLKAHDLPGIAGLIEAALDTGTCVLPAINGLPWWFFHGFGGPAQGLRIEAVDPGGVLSDVIPSDRLVGSVVYAASYVTAPGRIRLVKASKLWLGDVGTGAHAKRIAAFLRTGGIPAEDATARLHWHVWDKLWGNSNLNPLSALTRADVAQLLEDPHVRGLARAMMLEMSALAARIGLEGFDTPEDRIVKSRAIGAFRTSMLQDVDAGRPIEIGPILGALVELARHLDHPTPAMDGVFGLASLLDRNLRATGPAG